MLVGWWLLRERGGGAEQMIGAAGFFTRAQAPSQFFFIIYCFLVAETRGKVALLAVGLAAVE